MLHRDNRRIARLRTVTDHIRDIRHKLDDGIRTVGIVPMSARRVAGAKGIGFNPGMRPGWAESVITKRGYAIKGC